MTPSKSTVLSTEDSKIINIIFNDIDLSIDRGVQSLVFKGGQTLAILGLCKMFECESDINIHKYEYV